MSTLRPLSSGFATGSSGFATVSVALLLGALVGCGGPDPAAMQKDAEAALQAKDYEKALLTADEALGLDAVKKDPALSWRFHSLQLDVFAAAGRGKDVTRELGELGASHDKQLTAALYRKLAEKLRAAGDTTGANDVLVAGDKKFPEDPSFKEAIAALNSAGDPAEIERLKALGYLGD